MKDTGTGMTEDQLAKVFAPVHQTDVPTMRKFGGTGLALNITRRVVEGIDGSIEASSEANQGAVFTISIPMQADSENQKNRIDFEGIGIPIRSSDQLLTKTEIETLAFHAVNVEVINTIRG